MLKVKLYNNSIGATYHYLLTELADQRTNDWFLISSPLPAFTILGLYLYFSLKWGPRYMADKQPFKLQKILVLYNFINVIISIYIVKEGYQAAWGTTYNWNCEPVDFSHTPEAIRVARVVHMYFLAKMFELLDTIFFVIRKKEKQITFLHLYHHTAMPLISWGTTKYYPGGHCTFIGLLNSFVHIFMYGYYMLAAMGPKYQRYLFWKKYITTLQMLQFCLAFLHSSQLLFYDCGYPRWAVVFSLPNSMFFFFLFHDFYNKVYDKPDHKKKINGFADGQGNGFVNGCGNTNVHDDNIKNGHANGLVNVMKNEDLKNK